MTDVLFPVLSEDKPDSEGMLATWFIDDGAAVAEEQLLGEMQVDKVDAEVTAPAADTVQLLVAEDDAMRQGQPIARII